MKKRLLSAFMALALCLTLLPAPARAEEADAPEGGAPAVSEQVGTNENENGTEGGQQDTGIPDAGGAEDSKADAPESGEDENAGNNADAAVSAVQTMIDALPIVSELEDMDAEGLDAAYVGILAAYDAYKALNAEQQAQITGADCFKALLGWFSSPTAPLADAQSGVHIHCVCGRNHQEIGNHKSADEKTFIEWASTDSLPTSGAYYLTQDVTISGNVTLTGDVTLCLNGHTVTVSGIDIKDGGKLTLTDCADQQGTIQGSTTGIFILGSKDSNTETISNASFVMYGGKIIDFKNAVIAKDYSRFTMYGGSITGNNANSAAAVSGIATSTHVGDNLPTSIITMYGGEISGNTGEAGGGVYIGDNCTFTLAGGKISGNTATGREVKDPTLGASAIPVRNGGGGVYLDSWGKFYMTGGEISDNKASGVGGGVCVMRYVTQCSISITGGKITGNESTDNSGGGIYGGPAKLTIQNTEISGNKCAGSGGGILATRPLTLENVQITNNTASTNGGYEGGGVKLGGDDKNFKDCDALTVSGNTSISGNTPNNYYVDRSCLLPIKVSGALDENARIGICMNPAYDTDRKFLPTDGKDSVVAKAAEGVALSAANFVPDSYNSDYVVRDDTADGVKFGLCDHVVPEGSNECRKCHTTFVAVLEPKDESAKKGYFSDLSNGATFDNMTGKLKLLQDVTLSGSIITMRGGTPTLDLNGHTINGGAHFNLDGNAVLTVIDGTNADTTSRTLNVNFYVNPGCTLNLYDSKNKQGFQGTVAFVDLKSTGKLVSCGGKIAKLDLRPSNDYNVRLWQSNTQYCTVGIIRCVSSSETITVSEFLKKNHPGAMLYGTKSGSTAAERISGDTTINKDGVDGGTYTNLYLQTCEKHEPMSENDLKCKHCGAELVVKITAMKGETKQVGYFAEASKDKGTWPSGYAEAAAQLADWVNKDGCTDAKLFPLNDNAYSIPVTCKMTLVGTGHKYINVTVKDGADVLLEGGEYEYITVDGGKATIPAVKCKKVTVNGGKVTLHNECVTGGVKITGGEAIFESGTYDDTFEMNGGTVTVKDGVTFTKNYNLAFQVTKGTLNVEGGTITGGVAIENPVNLTISGGTFKQAVTITRYDDTNTGTCSISGGTFKDKLTLHRSKSKLSALLAEGCAYYQNDAIVSGEATELTNVTVKNGHVHTIDANTGECSVCKAKMEASVTVGDTTTYYETIGAAVAALNAAGDGARTLKLFQNINNSSEVYTLTNGPVTLDLNGKEFWGKPFIAQGITLTLKSEKAGGSVAAVQAVGKDSKIVANSTNIKNDGDLTVREISAKDGGRLEPSAGTFLDLYVVKDGSSASLSGGLYEPMSYPYGGGPEDKNGTNGKYVGAWDLLPKGYRYKEKQSNGSFSWVSNNSFKISTHKTYTVADAGASFEKIYPDSKTDFIGDTYVVNADESGKGSLTLTAKVTSPGKAQYDWRVMYQKADGTTDWDTVGGSKDPNKDQATYTGKDAATLTISNLPVGTHQYFLGYWLYDPDGKNYVLTGSSEPLTVVVTKHEHSWSYSASGATITAKCTADGCYLTDKLGGTFTISAPAADTLTYDGSAKEATAKLDAVSGVTSLPTAPTITYTQNGTAPTSKPVNAGEYTASITVGNATASVEYTIAKANPVVTEWPTISASVYVNSEATLTGGSGVGTFAFKAGAAKSWNSAGNKTTTVVFTPTDTNNYKALTRDYTVTVVKRTVKSCTTPTGITDKPCGTAQEGLGLPGTVTITTEDGKTFNNIPVTWGGYDPNTLEEQTLTGTLDLTSIADEVEQPSTPVTAQIQVKLTQKSFNGISAAAYEGVYDGNEHGIILTGVPSGATVKYGESADSCTRDSLTYTDFTNGAKTVYYKVSQSGYADASGSATVNITKRPLTVTGITVKNKTYDGKFVATVDNSGTLTGWVQGETLTHSVSAAFADKNAGIDKTVNLTITLTASGATNAENYTISDNSQKTAMANITTKEVTLTGGINATNRSYVKDNKTVGLTKGTLTFTGLIGGETLGANIPATGTISDAEVGAYNVTYSGVTLADGSTGLAANYALVGALPKITVEITKADYGNKSVSGSAKYGTTGSVDLSGYLAEGGRFGVITTADSEKVLSGDPVMEGNSLKFTFVNDASKANKMATITVPVTGATNYESYTITVTVTVNNKTTPVVTAPTVKTRLVYNGADQVLIDAGSTTGGTLQYSLTSGSDYSTELPKAKNAGTYTVYYKVTGNDGYADVPENSVSVSVAKRAISVKADNKSMTVNGTLPTFTVSYGNFASGDSEATVIETKATASCAATGTSTGSFTITVSGTTTLKSGMDTNYEVGTPESGTLTVNPRSSSGGGGGGSVSTYSVTVGKTENGSVSVSPKSASKGDTVTITVTPDKGYVLETLTVLDKNDKEIKLTEKNGKYTFTMPAGKVEVKVTFMDDNTMLNYFVDVKAGDYFYDAVKWAAEKGITSGTDATHFSPNAACTRAQIVTFLWRAAGSPEPKSTGSFADVPTDSYYAKAVSWAVENGITGGTGDGKFSPNATCTREQAVAFLYRASGSPAVSGGSAFNDVAANAYYADAVAWAEKNEITGGIGGGLFGSGNDCTRAQIVTFLYRTYQGK